MHGPDAKHYALAFWGELLYRSVSMHKMVICPYLHQGDQVAHWRIPSVRFDEVKEKEIWEALQKERSFRFLILYITNLMTSMGR